MVKLDHFSNFNQSLILMDIFSIGSFQMYKIDPIIQNWYPTQETKQFEPDENDIKLEV